MHTKTLVELRDLLLEAAADASDVADAHLIIEDEVNKMWNRKGAGYKALKIVEKALKKALEKKT